MCLYVNSIEQEVILRALRHYMLQCEMWRDATTTVRGEYDPGTLNWALMLERVERCINIVTTAESNSESNSFENKIIQLVRQHKQVA